MGLAGFSVLSLKRPEPGVSRVCSLLETPEENLFPGSFVLLREFSPSQLQD